MVPYDSVVNRIESGKHRVEAILEPTVVHVMEEAWAEGEIIGETEP